MGIGNMWKQWVLDATLGYKGELFAFCPVEGDIASDYSIITGMMLLSDMPPEGGKLVAIVHADGQGAVEEFCSQYASESDGVLGAAKGAIFVVTPVRD